jgi:hypothetical protein
MLWLVPVGLPEHAPLARRLGECVRDYGARDPPRRLNARFGVRGARPRREVCPALVVPRGGEFPNLPWLWFPRGGEFSNLPCSCWWLWLVPVGLPEHAPLARRLGECVRDYGARDPPRRLNARFGVRGARPRRESRPALFVPRGGEFPNLPCSGASRGGEFFNLPCSGSCVTSAQIIS